MTMIERVARAMYSSTPSSYEWGMQNGMKELMHNTAKLAIAAMREPTEEMLDAGKPIVYECMSLEPGEGLDENPALPTWQAMIDAALKE